MNANCASLLAYETDFRQGLFKNKNRKLDQTFNSSIRYIDDVLSQKILCGNYLHLIYPNDRKNVMTPFFHLPFHQQHHQRMEFIFHNSYTILDLVPSTVIFWQKPVDNYVISRSQMKMDLFSFTQICFFPLSPTILLPDLTVEHLNSPPFLTSPSRCSPLKPLRQINLQLLGCIYGRFSIKIPHVVPIR